MSITDMPINDAANCTLASGQSAPCDHLHYEVCVVGGGLAGLCAALAAARNGARTVLIQDRAVLGGNASSEVRMWALGAHGADNRETGIMEEIRLANLYYNPDRRFSVWDGVLYGLAREQAGLDLLLSCAVCAVEMAGCEQISTVRAWHLTRQRWQVVQAQAFIDCSGDSILHLSGAPCRWGREAVAASQEPHAQQEADRRTMGNTVLIQLREIDPQDHRPYIAPPWALKVDDDTFPQRKMTPTGHNFWWLEMGGLVDTIDDADHLRDDLVALAHGVWAFIKNHPDGRGQGWELEWIGALPGKRENVRYEGDHILSEMDITDAGQFPDVVAHGGWTMDDHPPAGIWHDGKDTTHYAAPSPYGIPYRVLYSRAVKNLWFAGRNISATHMAMSSTRVMATCAVMGQAAGTAAAMAVAAGCDNRAIYQQHLRQLQNRLMDADQWLPGRIRPVSPLTSQAVLSASHGDPLILLDGLDRRTSGQEHHLSITGGGWVALRWSQPVALTRLRVVADSKLAMLKTMPCSFPRSGNRQELPACLLRDARIEVLTPESATDEWQLIGHLRDNYRRLIIWQPAQPQMITALRLVVERGWGGPEQAVNLFAIDVGECPCDAPITAGPWPQTKQVTGGNA